MLPLNNFSGDDVYHERVGSCCYLLEVERKEAIAVYCRFTVLEVKQQLKKATFQVLLNSFLCLGRLLSLGNIGGRVVRESSPGALG